MKEKHMKTGLKRDSEKIRKAMIAKIHIAKKELGLEDEDYRFLLKSITGKDSCKYMHEGELEKVLEVLYALGFEPKKKARIENLSFNKEGMIKMIEYHAEIILGDNWKRRLRGYVKKKFGVDDIRWCSYRQLVSVWGFLRAIEREREEKLPF
jgi:phage gp16-like protein